MKLHYVKIDKDWDALDEKDSVIFELPTERIEYEIKCFIDWYLYHLGSNSVIFEKLGIYSSKYTFVKAICESATDYDFPGVATLGDLKKVIKALDDECVKKFGLPKVESTESKEGKEIQLLELKEGDYIKIQNYYSKFIYIFKEYKDNIIIRHVSYNLGTSEINIVNNPWGSYSKEIKITYATSEEKKLLDDALLKKGYIWDNVNKKLIEVSSANLMNKTSIGISKTPKEYLKSDLIETNITPVCSNWKNYNIFCDGTEEKPKEELNLFPTKKHYQLNFNY